MLEPTGATGGASWVPGSLRLGVMGEGEAVALKKAAEQAAGAGQGGAAERGRKDSSQFSWDLKGNQCAKPK